MASLSTNDTASIEAAMEQLSFSQVEYWRHFYQLEKYPYDWYNNFEELRSDVQHAIEQYKRTNGSSALVVGCGNSDVSKGLIAIGCDEVTSIDICETVIAEMKLLHHNEARLKWLVMDVQKLSFADSQFDVILDKGTMDAVLCQESACAMVNQMLVEVDRVLKPGGVYILITMGKPSRRLPFLKRSIFTWCRNIEEKSIHPPHQRDATNIYLMHKPIDSELHLRVTAPGKDSPRDYPPPDSPKH